MFPAHAGMNRSAERPGSTPWNVPRTRGDEPMVPAEGNRTLVMFPAHAGMNRPKAMNGLALGYVPRTRGDEPTDPFYFRMTFVCSPHTRG